MRERWDKVVKEEREKEIVVKKETPVRKKLIRGSRKKDKDKENSNKKNGQNIKRFLIESTKRKCENSPDEEKEKVETPGKRQKKEQEEERKSTERKKRSKEKENIVKDSDRFDFKIGKVQNLRRQFEDIRDWSERAKEKETEMVFEIGLQCEEKSAKYLKIGPSRKLSNLDTRWEGSAAFRSFKNSNQNGPIGRERFGGKTDENPGLHVSIDRSNPEGKHGHF